MYFIYVKERQSSILHWLIPAMAKAEQGWIQDLRNQYKFPTWVGETKILESAPLPPRVDINGKLNQKQSQDLNLGTLIWYPDMLSMHHMPTHCEISITGKIMVPV